MRIAFVIQTYRQLDQVGRLIDTLNQGHRDRQIVITHSGSLKDVEAVVTGRQVDCVLPAVPGRARFGLIDSYMSALRWLRRHGKPYDWVVLLSGQDYPLRPLRELAQELEKSPYDGYFYYVDPLKGENCSTGPMSLRRRDCEDRYFYRYAFLTDDLSRLERAALKLPRLLLGLTHDFRLNTSYGLCLGRRSKATPFSPGFGLYCGSYWHIIRRACAEAILDFADDNANVVDYFRHVILPDECFIQTVLLNNGGFRISSRDLRYFDFSRSRHGHPKTLGSNDLAAAFASGCFFARKFDIGSDPDILDVLDRRVCA
ncbi:MAG: beta-1,6-N-acetylglucosaminyltransferase [Xanthobacteraceae bacterium]